MNRPRVGVIALILASGFAGLPAAAHAAPPAPTLTLERLHADPPLAGSLPRQAELSPGGTWVSYLRPAARNSEELELWALPTAGGAPVRLASADDLLGGRSQKLTEAEAMALERKRISQRGITGYQWCGTADRTLLFPLSGDLYAVELSAAGPTFRRLTNDEQTPEQDPACSADGRQVAYVKGGNVWVQFLQGGPPRRLTGDASATVGNGLAEFIAAEELDRQRGFWWSPDGRRLLVLRVDESEVPLKRRAALYADRTDVTEQRYPAAGEANAKVTALVIDALTGRQIALTLPEDVEYIARAGWFDDGVPWLQVMNRSQTRLRLVDYPAAPVTPHVVIDERDDQWVETHDALAELKGLTLSDKPALLWLSEAAGRRQLVVVDRVTGARRPLTQQPEPVASVICNANDQVVFEGAVDRGRGRELFVTDLQGKVRLLSRAQPQSWRGATGDKGCTRLLVTRSSWTEPPRLELRGLADDAPVVSLDGGAPDPLLAKVLEPPQIVDIVAADGVTPLNAFWFPPTTASGAKVPVITMAYGGPGSETVAWRFGSSAARIAYWQQRGLGVFMVDMRGSTGRDRAFTRAHFHAFGRVEVDDLFAAVHQLPMRVPSVDASRIGFFGWSYGGFLAARAMLDEKTPFAAAVGVAPVTDWTLYDTAYTERYLGLPKLADGTLSPLYRDSGLLARATLLQKPLLLIHGTADDNVLFEHSLRLAEALQNEGRLFDTMFYPGKAHGISGRKARLHLDRTIDAFFARHLKPVQGVSP